MSHLGPQLKHYDLFGHAQVNKKKTDRPRAQKTLDLVVIKSKVTKKHFTLLAQKTSWMDNGFSRHKSAEKL